MPFKITIDGIGEKALGDLIARIGTDKYSIKLTYKPHDNQVKHGTRPSNVTPIKGKGRGQKHRVDADTVLTLGEKALPKPGSLGRRVVDQFQTLENTHGIGNVTRGVLQDALVNDKKFTGNATQHVTSLLSTGQLLPAPGQGGIDAATYGR